MKTPKLSSPHRGWIVLCTWLEPVNLSCLVGQGTLDLWCHWVRGVPRLTMGSPPAWDWGGLWERAPTSRALLLEYCLHLLTAPCVLSNLNPCIVQEMSTNKSLGVCVVC